MKSYYNENDPYAAEWLENLIAEGLIVPGDVDRRSIADISPQDLKGYAQCHFFAGIGGWSRALRLAGWSDSKPVWTGSCPCQPFSTSGQQKGIEDDRHLWPTWFELIKECEPSIVFGEQVASKLGLSWLDIVSSNMENKDYAFGSADLCAAGVGAPHIRQRLYWVGISNRTRFNKGRKTSQTLGQRDSVDTAGCFGRVADSGGGRLERRSRSRSERTKRLSIQFANKSEDNRDKSFKSSRSESESRLVESKLQLQSSTNDKKRINDLRRSSENSESGFWQNADWLPCKDKKVRPVESGTFPMAYGLPRGLGTTSSRIQELAKVAELDVQSLKRAKRGRKGMIKGYGNAIIPELASKFVNIIIELGL